jgi:hypothetical protein
MFKLLSRVAIVAGLSAGLIACADDPSDTPAPTSFALRVIHASPDAPNVDVRVGGATFVSDLGFKEATFQRGNLPVGTASVEVAARVPGGTATVIGPSNITFEDGKAYQIIAVGKVADATLAPLIIENPRSVVASGSVRAQVVHGAPAAPPVDVYVTGPTDDITNSMPLGSFGFGENLGPVVVPGGDYRIRVVVTGDATKTPVFDSGSLTLPGRSDLMIVAVENTNAGAGEPGQSPISLFVADNGLGSFEILDVNTPAQFRAVHFSPDTPSVNVLIDDDMMAPNFVELNNVPYPTFSDFLSAPAGAYNVRIELASNPGAYAVDEDLSLVAGKRYSVYAASYTNDLITDGLYVLEDDFRSVATEAKVRIVHLAPGAGLVDIYVTAPGVGIANVDPAFAGVDFKDETGYVGLAGGTYDVTVTLAGTKTAAIGPAPVDIVDGDVYTVVARDATGGGAPFGVTVLDELN